LEERRRTRRLAGVTPEARESAGAVDVMRRHREARAPWIFEGDQYEADALFADPGGG
jgi:hypothetical protein